MKGKILQIAGTDTEIGKTTAGSLLIAALVRRGIVPWVMKPVQTDCSAGPDGELIPGDAIALWEASGKRQTLDEVILFRYRSPVAPMVAAEAEGRPLYYGTIVEAIQHAAEKSPLVIYEGTGGILVPITAGKTFLDLARETGAETVVVMGSRLGAINHAALTFHTLRSENLPCLGYVFNDLYATDAEPAGGDEVPIDALRSNRKLLAHVAKKYGLSELAALPYLSNEARLRGAAEKYIAPLAEKVIEHFGLASEAFPLGAI